MRSQLNPDLESVDPALREKQKFNRVQPEWEDANNLGGGEYRFTLEPQDQDKQWELTLLAILGGSLPFAEEVCGIWLGIGRKSGSTLSLWKKTPDEGTPEHSVEDLAASWLKLLKDAGVPIKKECTFTPHQDAIDASRKAIWSVPPKFTWQPETE